MSTLPKDLAFDCIVVCEAAAKEFDTARQIDWCRAAEQLSGYVVRNYDMVSVGYIHSAFLDMAGRLAQIETEDAAELAGNISELLERLTVPIGVRSTD